MVKVRNSLSTATATTRSSISVESAKIPVLAAVVKSGSNINKNNSIINLPKTADHSAYIIKMIDLGSAIGVKEAEDDSEVTASASLMTFTAMEFAG